MPPGILNTCVMVRDQALLPVLSATKVGSADTHRSIQGVFDVAIGPEQTVSLQIGQKL